MTATIHILHPSLPCPTDIRPDETLQAWKSRLLLLLENEREKVRKLSMELVKRDEQIASLMTSGLHTGWR